MKTLKESILSDMENALQDGDKFDKQYKAAEKELNVIKSLCSDIKNWHGGEGENIDGDNINNGIAYDYQIFVNCAKLDKMFSLPGKKLYILIKFIPRLQQWTLTFEFTNAREMCQNPNCERYSFIKSFKQKFELAYIDTKFVKGKGKRSRFTPQEFIDKYVISNFTDMNTFEKEIVEVSHELMKRNCTVKYFNAKPI